MARPSDWWVLDLDGDPTPGSGSAIRAMARSWSQLSEDAGYAQDKIASLLGDGAIGAWVGEAGDAFRDKTGDLPKQLGQCCESYRLAADALTWWAGRLEGHQHDADAALVKGRAARHDLEAAKQRAQAAAASVTSAGNAGVLSPTAVDPDPDKVRQATARLHAAQAASSSAEGDVAAAQSRLDAARTMALDAKSLRESDGKTAAGKIHDASDAGIPERSRWEKFKDWAGEAWDVIVKIAKVVVAVLGVVALIIGGPLAWVVFAAALLVLADTIMKYMQGKASLWDVAFAALACIPGTKGLTTLAELKTAFQAGGLLGAGLHVLSAGKTALVEMAASLRALPSMTMTALSDIRRLDGLAAWQGKNGLTLMGKDLLRVEDFANAAKLNEPAITSAMKNMVADLPTSELAGLEFRVKTLDSLAGKVAKDMRDTGMSAVETLQGMKDTVRYTVMTPGEDFATASNQFAQHMADQGFESIGWKNSFGGDGYQGINTTWHDPVSGQNFEVQFHTPESLDAKQLTHPLYEAQRVLDPGSPEFLSLSEQQAAIFDTVPTPAGAPDVSLPAGVTTHTPPPPPSLDALVDHGRKPFQATGYVGVGVGALDPEGAR